MKTTGIFIFFICIQNFVFGQAEIKHCTLDYSGSTWVVTHKDGEHQSCNAILIKSIPPVDEAYTPIVMPMNVKGIYSLKKDASLEIYEDYEVMVEDLVTGQYYDLNSPEYYTFKVNRAGDKRFVLEINKKINKPGHALTSSK